MSGFYKPYERGFAPGKKLPENDPVLYGYDLDIASSEVLYSEDNYTEEIFRRDFEIKTGKWYVEDGWIVGKNPEMNPGMIVSKKDFFGAVMLEATVKNVSPSTHDINFMINGEWDGTKNERGNAYVAGLEGFWHGNVGYEKSPTYTLNCATSLFDYDPEKEHLMRFGNLGSKQFVQIDGRLCLEIRDPDPLDNEKYGKIGFEAFSSWWKLKNVKVYRLIPKKVKEYYNPEF